MDFLDIYQNLQNLASLHVAYRYLHAHTIYFYPIRVISVYLAGPVLDHLCVIMCATCVFCFLVEMRIFIILDVTRIAFTGNM